VIYVRKNAQTRQKTYASKEKEEVNQIKGLFAPFFA